MTRARLLRHMLTAVALAVLSGCAHLKPAMNTGSKFEFPRDTFAFANETVFRYADGEHVAGNGGSLLSSTQLPDAVYSPQKTSGRGEYRDSDVVGTRSPHDPVALQFSRCEHQPCCDRVRAAAG